jgi:DNA-binding NtrC family response regulator
MVYLCPDGQPVDSTMLSPHIAAGAAAAPAAFEPGDSLRLEPHVAALEERLIRAALERSGGNRSEAARLLGVSRNGLALKLERLGIRS